MIDENVTETIERLAALARGHEEALSKLIGCGVLSDDTEAALAAEWCSAEALADELDRLLFHLKYHIKAV